MLFHRSCLYFILILATGLLFWQYLLQNRIEFPCLSDFPLGQLQHHDVGPVLLQLTFCFTHKCAGFVSPMAKTDNDAFIWHCLVNNVVTLFSPKLFMHSDAAHQICLESDCHTGFTSWGDPQTTAGCIRSVQSQGCLPQSISDLQHESCHCSITQEHHQPHEHPSWA